MTIRKGVEWGSEQPRPAGLVELADDAAYGRLVDECRRTGRPIPPTTLRAGGLARTLGAPLPGAVPGRPGPTTQVLPIDLGRARLDGVDHWFAAHLVARRSWWYGPVVAVMNAEFLGDWDVAPRSHPNDGRLDVVEVDAALPIGQRWRARSRLPRGEHVPHPLITERRVREQAWTFARPMRIWLDGVAHGRVRHLEVAVEPDAAELCR